MFVAFCFAASGTYYWNDILDVDADRRHPKKRFRPIAAGRIPMGLAKVVGTLLLVSGALLSIAVWHWRAPVVLAIYVLAGCLIFAVSAVTAADICALAGVEQSVQCKGGHRVRG